MAASLEPFLASVEADLRQLASEAKRSESLAGQLTGWLSGPEHPIVKELAERAVLKLQSLAGAPDALQQLQDSKDVLKPFLLAFESKSPKLTLTSLVSVQKMVANDALADEGLMVLIKALEQVEKTHEEDVQLKMLQTLLTLMHSPVLAQNEEGVALVLGICLRLLASSKNTDRVVNTAAATVRQAVALVFDHVLVQMEENQKQGLPIAGPTLNAATSAPDAPAAAGEVEPTAATDAATAPALEAAAMADSESASALPAGARLSSPVASPTRAAVTSRQGSLARRGSHDPNSPRGNGAMNAALKLLDDLCMMATASEGMLKWLKAPSLPRPFVLDLLDFVLANSSAVFRTIPAFEHALLVRVCQLLITQLQNLLDPACDPALQQSDLRVVLRVTRTVVRCFYLQLRSKCGVFIEALLAGATSQCSLWQRINVLQVFRHLCADAHLIHFMFFTYDAREECKLKAIQEMVERFAIIIEKTTAQAGDGTEGTDAVAAVAQLYQSKAHGKEWSLDSDHSSAPPDTGSAYLAMLAIDSMLSCIAAVEKLTDAAVDGSGGTLDAAAAGRVSVERETCLSLCQATWQTVLAALTQLLQRCASEELTLQLLKGYQAYTSALGVLELIEPRDAYLASLCSFALSTSSSWAEEEPDTPAQPQTSMGKDKAERDMSRNASSLGGGHQPRAPPLNSETADGVVLTPKNVQALRTLFNVAHRLHHLLGMAWVLVLDILNALDRMLMSPRTTTQEVSASTVAGARASDLAILATAASQLFESTQDMSLESVMSILEALKQVSTKSIPKALQTPGPPRLYALTRMVEVVLHNMPRINELWPLFIDHIRQVLGHPKPGVRAAAIDALSKATVGVLARLYSTKDAASQKEGQAAAMLSWQSWDSAQRTDEEAVEAMLLGCLESLYVQDREVDVRLGLLKMLHKVLQQHGEHLSAGWDPILRLLEAVPQGEEADPVGLAFQSVQLLCSDHMSNLGVQLLKKCIEVAALYGSQQADLNVSLTAISMLWNASDLIAKLYKGTGDSAAAKSAVAAVPEAADGVLPAKPAAPDAHISSQEYEDLVRMLFGALQGISCTDARPEARNSGVRTLFSVVVSQGGRMSGAMWDDCLWEILFPQLRSVHQMSVTSSREEINPEVLGKLRGASVKMLMHHSRNSEQKQWDETLVLCLNGMGRLLKAHLPLVVPMQAFPQGWEELMLVVESSMAGGRKETALAAIGVVITVLQAHGATKAVSRDMWKRAMRAMDVGVEAAASPQCKVPLQARLELVNAIGQLQTAMHEVFEDADMEQVFAWLDKFVRNPYSEDDQLVPAGLLPPVQKAAFALFPSLVPLHSPALWAWLFETLLRLLRPHLLAHETSAPEELLQQELQLQAQARKGRRLSRSASPSLNNDSVHRPALSSLSMERVVEIVVLLYRDSAPWQARANAFAGVVTVLGECMATRFTAYAHNLWRAAARGLAAVVAAGLPAVNIAHSNAQQPPPDTWSCLPDAFGRFLVGTQRVELAALDTQPPAAGPSSAPATPMVQQADANGASAGVPLSRQASGGAQPGPASAPATPFAPPASDADASRSHLIALRQEDDAAGAAARVRLGRTGSTGSEPLPPPPLSRRTSRADRPGLPLSPRSPAAAAAAAREGDGGAGPQAPQLTRRGSRASATGGLQQPALSETEASGADAELELAVLDALTDTVLTSCARAPDDVRLQLIGILDAGITRPRERHIPASAAGSRFAHACLRKLYVLCSRGVETLGAHGCLLEVAQLAFPIFLARGQAMLSDFAQRIAAGTEADDRLILEETLCLLEICTSMTLAPAVVDAGCAPAGPLTELLAVRRRGVPAELQQRERAHLLMLYSMLCSCVMSREPRVSELVRDALLLAGGELQLCHPSSMPPLAS